MNKLCRLVFREDWFLTRVKTTEDCITTLWIQWFDSDSRWTKVINGTLITLIFEQSGGVRSALVSGVIQKIRARKISLKWYLIPTRWGTLYGEIGKKTYWSRLALCDRHLLFDFATECEADRRKKEEEIIQSQKTEQKRNTLKLFQLWIVNIISESQDAPVNTTFVDGVKKPIKRDGEPAELLGRIGGVEKNWTWTKQTNLNLTHGNYVSQSPIQMKGMEMNKFSKRSELKKGLHSWKNIIRSLMSRYS